MRHQFLKTIIIYTLSVLTTGSCMSLRLWQNNNSQKVIIQSPFKIASELRSSFSIPKISEFLPKQRDTNYVNVTTIRYNENSINNNIIEKVLAEDSTNTIKNDIYSKFTITNNDKEFKKYFTTTDETTVYSGVNEAYLTNLTETTTELTSETYSTEDYETTTSDEILSRSGVSPHIVASLLG